MRSHWISIKSYRVGMLTVACSLMLVSLGYGQGRIPTPLYVMPSEGVTDMNGMLLPGNANALGGLVQVLAAPDGVIYPPDPFTGHPNATNTVLPNGESFIGGRISPSLDYSGLFAVSLHGPRPSVDQHFFVRVYSGSTIEESIFYADSEVLVSTSDSTTLLYADVGRLTNIVSLARDTDGDGLPDWWEFQYFGEIDAIDDPDALLPGHRMTAREAYIAGTDPTDIDDIFMITSVEPHFGTNYVEYMWTDEDTGMSGTSRLYEITGQVLSWPSAEGREYDVEYATNILTGFSTLVEGLPAHESRVNTYTNFFEEGVTVPKFYRARVGWPDDPLQQTLD